MSSSQVFKTRLMAKWVVNIYSLS